MLEAIIDKMKSELNSMKEDFNSMKKEVPKIYQGYQFGKYLATDIKQRTKLVADGRSDHVDEIAIVLNLGEYFLAWEDVRMEDVNPYSLGIVF